MSGSDQATLKLLDPYHNTYFSDLPLGIYSGNCLGGTCKRLPVNTSVPYHFILVGNAPRTPGVRYVAVLLGVTSQNFWGMASGSCKRCLNTPSCRRRAA